MKTVTIHATAGKKAAALVGFCLLCGLLLRFPTAAANGATRGLAVCGNVLIPTLLPFMALSSFLVESGLSETIGRRLGKGCVWLFGLPASAAAGVLVSFIGGYPAGAVACAKLVAQGAIREEDARRMMRFCVVAGPAFVVGAVGNGLLKSPAHGWLLLLAQWAAALVIGIVGGRASRDFPPAPPPPATPKPVFSAVAVAVGDAARAMVVMCGFVTVTAGFLAVLDGMGLPQLVSDTVAAAAEVSVGCVAWSESAVALAACIGFGGLSVHGQIASLFSFPLLDRGFFAARICHALLAAAITRGLLCFVPLSVSAFAPGQVQTLPFSCGFTGSAALLATLVTALFSIPQKGT